MIAFLSGILAARTGDTVVIDVNGVGYEVFTPNGTRLPTVGDTVKLFTVQHVREDALTLYGFADQSSKDLFSLLISASGVGPKLALTMLSTLASDTIVSALRTKDIDTLVAVPGIGKKVAERLILELHDKATAQVAYAMLPEGNANAHGDSQTRSDVHEALLALGYTSHEADLALNALNTLDSTDASVLLRHALNHLTNTAK
jgi:Holliday junction DNA helicase RuvA